MLVATGLHIRLPVLAVIAVIPEHIVRRSALVTVERLLKDGTDETDKK